METQFIKMYFQYLYKYRSYILVSYCVIFVMGVWYFWQVKRNREYDYDDDMEHVRTWQQNAVMNDEPCHKSRVDDILELLTNRTKIPSKSIFFHETTCTGGLTSRQACAIESAAKANPERQINVLFTSSITAESLKNGCISILLDEYKNVKLRRVLILDYASGTPLESIVANMHKDNLNLQMSKILKYMTLYKYSGIYLSWDVVVARNFDLWANWAVKDSPVSVSADMFGFSDNKIGRKLAAGAMGFLKGELSINKVQDFWSYNGPSVMTHLLSTWCTTDIIEKMKLNTCKDIAVYDSEFFYPISFHDRKKYFNVVDWQAWKEKEIYTYFIWEHFTKYNLVTPVSLYGRIASEYCPMVYERYADKFGLWYYL